MLPLGQVTIHRPHCRSLISLVCDIHLHGLFTFHNLDGYSLGGFVCKFIASRRLEVLRQTAQEMETETGGKVVPMQLDVSSVPAVHAFVDQVGEQFGRIDILINSAGINVRKSALEFEESDWDKVLDTQLKYPSPQRRSLPERAFSVSDYRLCVLCLPWEPPYLVRSRMPPDSNYR